MERLQGYAFVAVAAVIAAVYTWFASDVLPEDRARETVKVVFLVSALTAAAVYLNSGGAPSLVRVGEEVASSSAAGPFGITTGIAE